MLGIYSYLLLDDGNNLTSCKLYVSSSYKAKPYIRCRIVGTKIIPPDAWDIFSLSLGLWEYFSFLFLVFRGAELGIQGCNQGR